MNRVVKILSVDGNTEDRDAGLIHLIDPCDSERTFCTGLVWFEDVEFEELPPCKKGGFDCPQCISKVKIYKSIKL